MGKVNAGHVLGGAATGAALGSMVPIVGTGAGAIAGGAYGLLSDLFSSDDDSGQAATQAAAQAKLAAMQKAAGELQDYRPIAQQQRVNEMNSQLGRYAGLDNVMRSAYGGQPGGQPTLNALVTPHPGTVSPLGAGGPRPVFGAPSLSQGPPPMPQAPQPMGRPTLPGAPMPMGPPRPPPRPSSMDDAMAQLGGGR